MVGWHHQLNGPEFEKLWELVGCAGTGGLRGAIQCSRSGGVASDEIPLIQDKEQRLCFAGAAVKRYPIPKVRETPVRW